MFKHNVPIYEQVKDMIINNIIRGKWDEGEKIPSVRGFAGELEVNPNTIMNALKELQKNEIIKNKRGIGNLVGPGVRQRLLKEKQEEFLSEKLREFVEEAKLAGISIDRLKEELSENWQLNKIDF